MNKILKNLSLASLLITSLNANTLEDTLTNNKVFTSIKFGYTHLNNDFNTKSGTVNLAQKQDSSSSNLNLELGFEYSQNIELSINYQRVFNDDVNLDNIYLQSKYLFKQESFTPYLGASIGYSQLSWDKNPINTVNNDKNSGSYLLGLSAGILYPITNKADLIIDYSLFYTNHSTDLNPSLGNSAVIEHDYSNSISVGFRWNF